MCQMTGFTRSEVFREMATMQQVSLRRLIRLQRGAEREMGGKFPASSEHVPCPCGCWLVEKEDSRIVVAIQKVEVLDVDNPLCESAEVDGITGEDAVVLAAQERTTDYNHH